MGKTRKITVGVQSPGEADKTSLKKTGKKKKQNKFLGVKQLKKTHGKKYRKGKESIKKKYTISNAVKKIKEIAYEKFDATIELHINTIESGIKGEIKLPHGTGKQIKVEVFSDKIKDKLEKGNIDFDVLIARPQDMKILVKYARLIGPKGLMPTPKKGTVVENTQEAKEKFSQGTVQYKTENKFPIIHQLVGKKSFTDKQIVENITIFIKSVGLKKIKSAYLSSTMSPSISLDLSSLT